MPQIETCPKCKSKNFAEILWGYFPPTDEIDKGLEQGKYILGGCLVTDHDPKWECNDCCHRWGERED